jgi:hypothetical protein
LNHQESEKYYLKALQNLAMPEEEKMGQGLLGKLAIVPWLDPTLASTIN